MHTKADGVQADVLSTSPTLYLGWRSAGLFLMICILAVVGLFWGTVANMLNVWTSSRTFAHGLLVFPVTGYLIWSYRELWIELEPKPSAWGLSMLSLAVCGWLLGRRGDLPWLQEFAVVAMLPGLVWTLFGKEIAKSLSWPLGFLIFMIPVGMSIEPWLQDITALFIRGGLHLAGVPYLYEPHRITLTTKIWTVDPDCGGLRYLLPGLALGYAFVTLMYRRAGRRVLFLVFCAVVLMFANGVRAYGVILGDHYGIADGTDHRVFSYTVYGLTMPLLFWLGLRWQETIRPPVSLHPVQVPEDVTTRTLLLGIAALVILAFAPLVAWLWEIGP